MKKSGSVRQGKADKRKAKADKQKAKASAKQKRQAELLERKRVKADLRAKRLQKSAERAKRRAAISAKVRNKLRNSKAGFEYNGGFIPRVELAVKGDRTSAVVRLSAVGISVSDIRFDGGETLFKIRKKDLKKAVAILSEMCYTHRINQEYGVARKAAFSLARIGLCLGAVVSVLGLYISYGYIWRVQITGNSVLSSQAIESALKRAGIASGSKKRDGLTDFAAAELGGMAGISDASCEIIGTTLYVHVLESTDNTSLTRYGQYVSDYDATVTRVVMRSGTALVKRGDVVGKGDLLADGSIYSTQGELMYIGECDCDVYGKVAITVSAQIPTTAVEYRPTGRTSVKTVYTLFGNRLGSAKPPYRSYELSTHTSRYDVLVPLVATTYTYRETAPVEYERDITIMAEDFAKAKIDELRFDGEFDYTYNVEQTLPGLYTVHLFLTGETVISRGRQTSSA